MNPRFFEIAKKLSYKSDYRKYKLGAVVVKRNRILGMGFNKLKTHTRSKHQYHMLHAELDAILGVPLLDLRNADIYVFRQTRDGFFALAKPCRSCEALLREVGIKRAFYTSMSGYRCVRYV